MSKNPTCMHMKSETALTVFRSLLSLLESSNADKIDLVICETNI